ncbi:hypothetical protein ACDX78_20030 [Virgibacillus oceani]
MKEEIILRKSARQRLEVKASDLEYLAFLEQQRLLSVQQFYQAYSALLNNRLKDYSFKNRVRKFEEYNLIRSNFYSNGFEGERFKYVTVGSKSIELLIENEFLDGSYNKSKIYKFNQKKNVLHYLATQKAVINILAKLNESLITELNSKQVKYGLFYNENLFSISPAHLRYEEWIPEFRNLHRQNKGAFHSKVAKYMTQSNTSNLQSGKTMTIVKPDWIIKVEPWRKRKPVYLNIELDLSTEPIETLTEKDFKYAIVAENNLEEQHHLCIVIADNSFSNRSQFGTGIKRTQNIIKRFKEDKAVMQRIKESSLIVLVHPLSRIEEKIHQNLCKYS